MNISPPKKRDTREEKYVFRKKTTTNKEFLNRMTTYKSKKQVDPKMVCQRFLVKQKVDNLSSLESKFNGQFDYISR